MKKPDCKFYYQVVDTYARQTGEESFYLDAELVDEVCSVGDTPLHHDEYDCENCPLYKKITVI